MEYVLDEGKKYHYSYQEMREEYLRFCRMTDDEFKDNIVAATHLACFICFLKEIPTYVCLSDTGIIHELVHQIHIGSKNTTPFGDIRKLFAFALKLD